VDAPLFPDLPDALKEGVPATYVPSPAWSAWVWDVLIAGDGALCNPDHAHLRRAEIGVLLTNETNERKGRRVLGTAREGPPSGTTWAKGQKRQQIERWFGDVPDFLITLDGFWMHRRAQEDDAAAILALVEHELYHCAQDGYNRRTGKPKWTMRAHDVEEFVGVVRRYGAGAPADQTARLAEAVRAAPDVASASLDGLCGQCGQAL
jgi:hypothetical protein